MGGEAYGERQGFTASDWVLQATEIGGKEGVNERSREWEARVDQEGEEGLDGWEEH